MRLADAGGIGGELAQDPLLHLAGRAARLARFKRPAEVRLLPALPRGATGKVKKGILRQLTADPDGVGEPHR